MNIITRLRRYRWYILGRKMIKKKIKYAKMVKVILGSGGTNYNGWIATDLPHFNLLKERDWKYFFKFKKANNFLAEHVLEHLNEKEVETVLRLSNLYLKKDGVFRIAVPDKNHPNSAYIEYVRPGGSGPGADDHKSFWDFNKLSELANNFDFNAVCLEYADENRVIQTSNFSINNGVISRSISKGFQSEIENYSSLIVDLIKNKNE